MVARRTAVYVGMGGPGFIRVERWHPQRGPMWRYLGIRPRWAWYYLQALALLVNSGRAVITLTPVGVSIRPAKPCDWLDWPAWRMPHWLPRGGCAPDGQARPDG